MGWIREHSGNADVRILVGVALHLYGRGGWGFGIRRLAEHRFSLDLGRFSIVVYR